MGTENRFEIQHIQERIVPSHTVIVAPEADTIDQSREAAVKFTDFFEKQTKDGNNNLVVDVTNHLVLSATLRSLVEGKRDCLKNGGDLVLVVGDQQKETVEFAGLDSLFRMYENVESAVADLG